MKVRGDFWLAVGSMMALVVVATAVIGFVPIRGSRSDKSRADALLFKKGDPDAIKVGKNTEAAIGPNEFRSPDASPDLEAFLQRAYPAGDIPTDASWAAQGG
ncbi:MAG TPA: hypothetical protein VN810_10075, partial [Terriglobales bacterium]|nr:hypothetical protein [Terriglobales bacterium]